MSATKTKTKTAKKKNALPVWDLGHLVPAPFEKNAFALLAVAEKAAARFHAAYAGRVHKLSAADFGKTIIAYEDLLARCARVYHFAYLNRATQLDNAKAAQFYQTVAEEMNALSGKTLFFTLEINKLSAARLKTLLKNKTVARYKPWLGDVRATRPHQLEDRVEYILLERNIVNQGWTRLFAETGAGLRFPVNGKNLTIADIYELGRSPDRAKRAAAAKSVAQVYGQNIKTFSLIMNTVTKICDIDNTQRGYKTPVAARNLENRVEDKVVDALVKSVRGAYKNTAHRYYKQKARWMKLKQLESWDRNAPLPFSATRKYSWHQAKDIVLSAYHDFDPGMAAIGQRFFDENWIDARLAADKNPGAFSAPTVPDVHPYILMNYQGKVEDVMTLAHELGHGIHQVLSAKQGYLMSDTPLTLAETASIFGEMLVFRKILSQEPDPLQRKAIIAGKVEDMLNTVCRQIAYHNFETIVHAERKKQELTPDRLGDIWMDVMQEYMGPAFRYGPHMRHGWAMIPHLVEVPFYVYAYAFGDCLVNALYATYAASPAGFAEKYTNLLAAGGTQPHGVLLKPFGLNAADPSFWKKGLSMIADLINELE